MENQEIKIDEKMIVNAIKSALATTPLIKPTQTVVNTSYAILKAFYLENNPYVVLEAPTGSGKSIIGFIIDFSILYIKRQIEGLPDLGDEESKYVYTAYMLTSNKMLQDQFDRDIERFDYSEFVTLLKGGSNYECFNNGVVQKDVDGNKIELTYSDRPCKGYNSRERESKFQKCNSICPYQLARRVAAETECTIFNYAYFLNVMRSKFKTFFDKREVTIHDEAHLIPKIVCGIFNTEYTKFLLNRLHSLFSEMEVTLGSYVEIGSAKYEITRCFSIFEKPLYDIENLKSYYYSIKVALDSLGTLKTKNKYVVYEKQIKLNIDRCEEALLIKDDYYKLLERPEDIYFESELVTSGTKDSKPTYKHIIKDLDESGMIKNNLLANVNKALFMSATISNMDDYCDMIGLPQTTKKLRIGSTFDYSKSPIYMCNSGWLNYNNFDSNIDSVLMDCVKICNSLHPNEKGIIHTGTHKISKLIKNLVEVGVFIKPERFLFYETSEEKEQIITKHKTTTIPTILIGPGLQEGLDLPDDLGRFNILVKEPYDGINDYVRVKMRRYPNWYRNETIDKIIQQIGRTNRHVNDYSTTYLLATGFKNLIFDTNADIVGRLRNKVL